MSAAIEVAWIELDVATAELRSLDALLTDEERGRIARRATVELRRRATVSLASRRLVAAQVLGTTPESVELTVAPDGRRGATAPGAPSLALSVSTCGATGVVAVARGLAVGVDVEDFGEVPATDAFVGRVTTPGERHAIQRLADSDRQRTLLALWTRKEAYLKATGEGIGARLTSLEVPLDVTLRATPWHPVGGVTWLLWDLDVPRPGLAAALAAGPFPHHPLAAAVEVRVRDGAAWAQ